MRSNLQIAWKLISSAVLLLFIFSTIWTQPAVAQSEDSKKQDIQKLKDKLEQLDRMMKEAREELNALESAQQRPPSVKPAVQEPAVAKGTSAKQERVIAVPSEAVIATPQIDVVPLEGEITEQRDSINFYGFAMLDSGYNFGQINPDWYDTVRPTQLSSYPNEFAPSGTVFASVRQTRFGVKTSTPTPLGDLNTIFEFDLFAGGGQTTFNLRHAYGELGQLGAGQTWSAFMDITVFPDTIEPWGPSGLVIVRNPQVRWMPIRSERGSVTVALEKPGATGDHGVYADRIELNNIRPRFNFPDLSGNARIVGDWGHFQTSAIVRKIGWVDTSGNPVNHGGSVVGWGINLTSNLNLSKTNVAKLAFAYGHGIENYMDDAPIDVGVEHNPSNPDVPKGVALPVLGIVSFLDHAWNEHFTSSIGYSFLNIQNSNAQMPSDYHQGDYAVANLLYHPIPKVTMGSEFQFGRRVNFSDGFNTNDYRLQFSFKFDWEKSFKSPTF